MAGNIYIKNDERSEINNLIELEDKEQQKEKSK